MLHDAKHWISLVVGLLVLALGLVPLLFGFGLLPFSLPEFLTTLIASVAAYLIAGFGLYLLIDGFLEDYTIRIVSVVVALLVIVVGIVQILFSFGIFGFSIPFFNDLFYNIIFTIEGIFLIIASFAMQ